MWIIYVMMPVKEMTKNLDVKFRVNMTLHSQRLPTPILPRAIAVTSIDVLLITLFTHVLISISRSAVLDQSSRVFKLNCHL